MKKKKEARKKNQEEEVQTPTDSAAERKQVTAHIKKKMLITVGLIVCGFCLLVIKLGSISIFKHEEYAKLATSQQLRDTVITAPRGSIYDTNMEVLARSASAWSVSLTPKNIEKADYELIATGLSEILGVDYDVVYEKCGLNTYYTLVKRRIEQPDVEAVRAFISENDVGGIQIDQDTKRYYPYGNFAAQVIGFVGDDNVGLEGLEAYYNSTLSGTPGRKVSAANAVGGDMYYDYETVYEAQPGNSLVLTIDSVIQHYLEKHLESAVAEHNIGNRASGIVMNVKTGEILAMATKGDYDPNDPFTIFDEEERARIEAIEDRELYLQELQLARQLQWRNKAIADTYEPGSVFKVVTASAALETGACTVHSTFYCSGSVKVGGETMSCARTSGHGSENFVQAIINSCNPAFIEIGRRVGAEDFYRYFEAFGLTEKTGIDIPGEATSIYYKAEQMGPVELASCSFGQSNSITPIQMITAVAAAVNGGYLVQPHLVRQVIDDDGNIVESYSPSPKRQVISTETSALMAEILEQVVMNANGRNAYVAGFRIGGKSGTSQKLNVSENVYIASFCAVGPTDDPEIAVFIMLDEPHSPTGSIYGGVLAAPIAGAIMAEVLPYIGVDAIYTDSEMQLIDVGTPQITGLSLTNAYAALQKQGLTYQVNGNGTTVTGQFPLSGQSLPRGSVVMIYTEDETERVVTVPSVEGRSVESARSLLRSLGLNMKVSSSGSSAANAVAVSQSIEAGEVVVAGTVVTVSFIIDDIAD